MENGENKLTFKEKIASKFNTGALQTFFMGKWYPILVAVMVLLGHSFGLEVYLSLVNVLLLGAALFVCESVRPLIVVLCSFLYQVPLSHSPGGPVWSDHYLTRERPYLLAVCVIVVVVIFVYAVWKFGIFSNLSFKNTPLLLSTCILGGAFLLNGAFSSTWQAADLLYGLLQALLFPFLFLIFYNGLRAERNIEDLGLYVAYVAAVIGVVLSFEMADLYLFGNDYYGTIFDDAGSVIKDRIHLGWATWNPVGSSIAVLIPAIFYGVIKSKYPVLYLVAAVVTYLSAILTFSRNAMIVSTLAFCASVLIACFFGEEKRKKAFRILTLCATVGVLFFIIVFWSNISVFAKDIFERGLSDNGRFSVWSVAIENFKDKPVFGTGFYHFFSPVLYNYSPAIPLMAHNTFLQLLSSMGFVGLVAYMYYRVDTAEMFLRKPTVLKSMLGLSVLALLLGSLLDNFIFTIFPLFFYSVVLAVAARVFEEQKVKEAEFMAEQRKNKKKRKGRR